MTDKKISELDAITGSNTAATDVFVVVDTSTGQTKKITREELNNAIERDVLDSIDIDTINGDFSVNGNINLGDNNKAIFGAGSDLQIYHDGTDSYIRDAGTGSLVIQASENLKLQSHTGEYYFQGIRDGASKIYYDNAEKLVTTSTGIDVAGTVTADGLTVDTNTLHVDSTNNRVGIGTSSPDASLHIEGSGVSALRFGSIGPSSNSAIRLSRDDITVTSGNPLGYLQFGGNDSTSNTDAAFAYVSGEASGTHGAGDNPTDLTFGTTADGSSTPAERMRIDSSGNVGIGTSSPSNKLHVDGHIKYNGRLLPASTAADGTAGAPAIPVGYDYNTGFFRPTADTIGFSTNATERMRIDSSGRVGIGTSSPSAPLEVNVSGASDALILTRDTGTNGELQIDFNGANANFNSEQGGFAFETSAASNAMTITSAGLVGIGTSSPNGKLHVKDQTDIAMSNDADGQLVIEGNGYSGAIALNATGMQIYQNSSARSIIFGNNETEQMRIDSSGNVLIGNKTGLSDVGAGHAFAGSAAHGLFYHTRDGGLVGSIKRATDNGHILRFVGPSAHAGYIGTLASNQLFIASNQNVGLKFLSIRIRPCNTDGSDSDNDIDMGALSARFDDIYATNGTIQTSDQNEKQQIASLTDAEITAAKAISTLFKTFKWNDSVAENGDNARTHTGVIAQDVQQAMTDAGLDAGDYAFFISAAWWETQTEVPAVEAVEAQDAVYDEDGNLVTEAVEAVEAKDAYTRTDTYDTAEEAPEGATERTRLGIRYPELLAFVGAATEQRLADIETRIATLEGN